MAFHVPKSLERRAIEIEGWLDMGLPEHALEKMEPLLAHPGARPVCLALKVRALVDLERFSEALELIAELRSLPHDPEWLAVTEGWCRRRTDDLPGAIRTLERLIATSRSSAIGHYNLACYFALAGRPDEACAMLAHAIAIDTTFRREATTEEDFAGLSRDPRFRALIDPVA